MSIVIQFEPVPLQVDPEGTIRVGGTRVTLETIVDAYAQGATAEEIAQEFSAVSLADVHATLAYYLRHRAEVEEYRESRRREAAEIRGRIEADPDTRHFRQRLLARRSGSNDRSSRIS